MADILLIQVPADATPAQWAEVQKALMEARSITGGDIARQSSPEATVSNVAPVVPSAAPVVCQACGEANGSHKNDCMFAAQNVPNDASNEPPPFIEPASNPQWLDDFVQANGRLPQNGEVSDNWMHILGRLKGVPGLSDDLVKLRKQATTAKARAVKAWNASHATNENTITFPPVVAPVVQASPLAGLPAIGQNVNAQTPQASAKSAMADFQHVTQLTDAQKAALAEYGTHLTPQRAAIVAAFLNGQATSENFRAITTKGGTFYDKVKGVLSKV